MGELANPDFVSPLRGDTCAATFWLSSSILQRQRRDKTLSSSSSVSVGYFTWWFLWSLNKLVLLYSFQLIESLPKEKKKKKIAKSWKLAFRFTLSNFSGRNRVTINLPSTVHGCQLKSFDYWRSSNRNVTNARVPKGTLFQQRSASKSRSVTLGIEASSLFFFLSTPVFQVPDDDIEMCFPANVFLPQILCIPAIDT